MSFGDEAALPSGDSTATSDEQDILVLESSKSYSQGTEFSCFAQPLCEKSKKKKKKKKTKTSDGDPAAINNSKSSKQEADKRFMNAMDLLQSDDEDAMWIRLNNCGIYDAKTRKLCDALSRSKTVMSLDLSCNQISPSGCEELVEVLTKGGAPDLILLDLRNNPLGEEGEALLEALQKSRKQLKIEYKDELSVSASADDVQEGGNGHFFNEGPFHKASLSSSSLVRQYFVVGNEEEDLEAVEEGELVPTEPPEELCERAWAAVAAALAEQPVSIPALGYALKEAATGVEEEMSNCHLPLLASTTLEDLRPFTRRALKELPVLRQVLHLVPPPLPHSFDRGSLQPAVGSHRVAVAVLVAQLLRGQTGAISEHLASSCLLPLTLLLAWRHRTNSALHCAVLSALRFALGMGGPADGCRGTRAGAPDVVRLMAAGVVEPLLREGWGLDTEEELRDDLELRPLHWMLAEEGSKLGEQGQHERGIHAGFVISLSSIVEEGIAGRLAEDSHLLRDEAWLRYAGAGGQLQRLKAEQRGPLGGYKPQRFEPDPCDFLLGGFGRMNGSLYSSVQNTLLDNI